MTNGAEGSQLSLVPTRGVSMTSDFGARYSLSDRDLDEGWEAWGPAPLLFETIYRACWPSARSDRA